MILEVIDKLALALVLYMQIRMMREQRAQSQTIRGVGETVEGVRASLRPRRWARIDDPSTPFDPDATPKD